MRRVATLVETLREKVFGNREVSRKAKITVYNAVVVPSLLYEYETCMGAEGQAELKK